MIYVFVSMLRLRSTISASWTLMSGLVLMCVVIPFITVRLGMLKDEQTELLMKLSGFEWILRTPISSNVDLNSMAVVPSLASSKILSTVTADMQALAQQSGLIVSDVNYKPIERVITSNLSRVDISTKFRGTYTSLKKFIAVMLSTYDNLVLESISIRRDRSMDLMLDIGLHWTLFCRKQP